MTASRQTARRHELPALIGQQFTLRRSAPFFSVAPRVDFLEDVFYTHRHLPLSEQNDCVHLFPAKEPLLWPFDNPLNERQKQRGFAGLEPLVADLLKRAGASVALRGKRPKVLPEIVEGPEIRMVDRSMLEHVQQHDRGIIHYDAKVQPAKLIAQIVAAWPKKRVMIAATREADARQLAGQLRAMGVAAHLFTTATGRHHRRVIVGTYLSFAKGAAAAERRHIFIALNPTELFEGKDRDYGTQLIKSLWRARMWGLMPLNANASPRLWDMITALFGVEEIVVPKHGFRLRPVHVVTEQIMGGPRVPSHKDDLLIRRLGITEHPVRNRRILRLARAIATRTGARLRAGYPSIWSRLHNGRRRTCILVDDVEHGCWLANKLHWPMATARGVNQTGLPEETRWVHPPEVAAERHVVATTQGLARVHRFDIIIRADAGVGMPALLGSQWRQRDGHDDDPLVIVDFDDRHHPLLGRNARRRGKEYLAAGWSVDGRTMSPLDVFLADRPEVWA